MSPGDAQSRGNSRRYVVPVIGILVLLAGGYGIYRVISGDSPRKRVIETVALRLVPPPPPPKVEPPPEPPKMVEEQKIEPPIDKPEDTPKDEPPPGPLALDAQAGPGGDAFGLGGKVGGADFLNGGGGTRFGHYQKLMIDKIADALQNDERLRSTKHGGNVKIWLSDAGKIERAQFLRPSGDNDADRRIEQVIAAMPPLPEPPPKEMPRIIVMRVGVRPGA
jgi:TonB family protein